MRKAILAIMAAGALAACGGPSVFGGDRYEVYGVEDGDLLKLRGGPGTGFEVHMGLPNGTIVRVADCTPVGAVRWCEVTVEDAPGTTGHVSQSYLRKIGG